MNDRYHFERIIWKTLVFESWKQDRKSRIEGEGNNNAFNEEKTSLVSNWYCLFRSSGACTRTMASSPSSFFPLSLSHSLFLFLPLNFPSNERNGHATLTFHHLRHPRMAQGCRRRCFRVSCEERRPSPFLSIEHSVRFTDTDARDCE